MDSYKNNKINKQTYIYLMCAHCGTVCFALTRFSHTQAAIKYSRTCKVHISSALKNGASKRKQKHLDFLKKKPRYILPVSCLTCSAKSMLFRLLIYHQNKDEGVCFICIICIYVCIYLYLFTHEH